MIVEPGEQDVERDLVRRLLPRRAFDERDHPVEEGLARLRRDAHDDLVREHARAAGDRRAVAARLADHRRRLAGDRRLVDRRDALDDVAVAGDELARRRRRTRRRSCSSLDDFSTIVPSGWRTRATVSERVLRSVSACALPRPSATASAKLANSTVNHSHAATSPANTLSDAVADGSFWKNSTVVRTLPTSTTNITGLRAIWRGSSFTNESPTRPLA